MQKTERKHGLDLLRAFAILFVVIHHIPRPAGVAFPLWFDRFSEVGWTGVDLFFVLSGFLIGSQVFHPENKDNLKTFWLKRWMRTLPLYYVVLIVYVFIKPMMGFPFKDNPFEYLFFTQNYLSPTDFVQSWSLCIEEHFYLVFPVLIYLFQFKKRKAWIWLLPLGFSLFSRAWLYFNTGIVTADESLFSHTVRFMTHNHLDGISLGVFLAKTYPQWKSLSEKLKSTLAIIGFALVTMALYLSGMYMRGPIFIYSFTLSSIGYGMLLIYFEGIRSKNFLSLPLEKIALWSYGAYIWNHLIIRNFYHIKISMNWMGISLTFVVLSFAVAALTYYTVERPALRLRNRLLLKSQPISR